jgi:hypothetical protein
LFLLSGAEPPRPRRKRGWKLAFQTCGLVSALKVPLMIDSLQKTFQLLHSQLDKLNETCRNASSTDFFAGQEKAGNMQARKQEIRKT